MQSKAQSVEAYLAELPLERREVVAAVREVVLANLDPAFVEGMQYGMIGYYVPHRAYPAGYHCDPAQPLPFLHLAAQKNYYSLYLFGLYTDAAAVEKFTAAWQKTGLKLDLGKSCLRFKKLADLSLPLIAKTIKGLSAKKFIKNYEAALRDRQGGKSK
ncbi:MAG: DUF1801 domain-containing protein [Pirellulales bacterium]|nr:DUF1801 domain-containing protein [Pirellulales bacterium]